VRSLGRRAQVTVAVGWARLAEGPDRVGVWHGIAETEP
jgi:hypothetical protein